VVAKLRETGDLAGEPRRTVRPVKFYEKGDKPLEIVSSRQWFIRSVAHQDALLERGAQLDWHPAYMRARYEDWVRGLNGDWLVSRQRFFGVPFPLWYPLDAAGEPDYTAPITPAEDALPVDPSSDTPPGFREDQRGRPGGFVGDPDVMDTWATSSLTPQLVCGWESDPDRFALTFPMDLRPQAHDIIRTWLFATVLRAELIAGTLPWRHAALSGWILDPDRKKMSKSKGNVVTPMDLLEQFSPDAVRYWAASGRPGTDTAFDQGQMKIGRRLATKLLNASKFVLSFPSPAASAAVSETLDLAVLSVLDEVVGQVTAALEDFEYTTALERIERFFWMFCDDYLELVKDRAYGSPDVTEGATDSARLTLRTALSVLQRLLAPYLPFAAEEAWSWWHDDSVHTGDWPVPARPSGAGPGAEVIALASGVIGAIRKAKSDAKRSMRSPVRVARVSAPAGSLAAARAISADLRAAGNVATLLVEPAADQQLRVDVTLAED
jgi:valyl-tRNA synthetase